ncbi:ammonium transporter [Reichenbachiella agarivorans]|uniref:Ammonium transporter n=1 Tax=Reichenbachiella agarivorans TaxID=2979464 RepID=A0ABY6CTV0_9BACT|nr:ammonium transporter [Reichenbachiella agarivorans]UXP33299.1 ammonium transporter [Reichenbachiella agarivorans]
MNTFLTGLITLIASPPDPNVVESLNLIQLNLDDLWVLVAAALVFFMQAGFKVLETGLVKKEHRSGIGAKNLLDWVAGSIAFFLVGFAIMFGDSTNGIFGFHYFAGDSIDTGKILIFFLFQLAFAGTALTIVSGAMSGRTGVVAYFIVSLITATIIYPVFGHWAWGNLWVTDNEPWLASLGFMDFAGSTVVHSTGAWVAVMGIYMVGPRLGRYDAYGRIQPTKASDYAYSILGVMILWLGWWGFNGGSTLAFNNDVPQIILNTNLAGAGACFSAFFHAYLFQKKTDVIEKIAGGSLTGLVAITACCNVVTPISSLIIGLLAGVIHNIFYVIIAEKWKLDDPVGAIAVHGIGGVFGTLCVALFGQEELLVHSRWIQLGTQFIGIATCFIFTTFVSYIVFSIIKKTIGLRVSPVEEKIGSFVGNSSMDVEINEIDDQKVAQVSIRVSDKGYNIYSVIEYLSINQERRKKMISEDRVRYMDEMGSIIPPLVAVRQMGLMLDSMKEKATAERDELRNKQEEYDNSLQHMGSLQNALLEDESSLKDLFEDSFLIFQPQKKVSGDFYWFKQISEYKIVIVSNCTGKGVSGGFLGMLGISLVKEIFSSNKLLYPDKVLKLLDKKFEHSLKTRTLSVKMKDAMDVSIIIVDELKQKIYFSGANNSVMHVAGNTINEYQGAKWPIGQFPEDEKGKFSREVISYLPGESIYLYTNGYYHQTNINEKPLGLDSFKSQLKLVQNMESETQKTILMDDFKEWKGSEEQKDDVLVIGIKLR